MRDRVVEILRDYRDRHQELDVFKVAEEIRGIVASELKDDLLIAENIKAYWLETASGAEK